MKDVSHSETEKHETREILLNKKETSDAILNVGLGVFFYKV